MMTPSSSEVVAGALNEDIGRGDLTTLTLVPAGAQAEAKIVAKEEMVLCGMPVMAEVFRQVDSRIRILPEFSDGSGVCVGNQICAIRGPARGILSGERVALNFIQNLSAVASLTRKYVEQVKDTRTKIVDTRKTVPGMRLLQKYAVRIGGGNNHRMGLDDGILIKENHIAVAGGIHEAVSLIRDTVSHLQRIEVECENMEQVEEALAAGAHIIMLDNMTTEMIAEAVKMVDGQALLEASGSVTLDNVREIAETGVDLISVGALTHSAGSRDVSLLITIG